MFSDVVPYYMNSIPGPNDLNTGQETVAIHKAYWEKIDGLNKKIEDMRQCYWNEVNDLKQQLKDKDKELQEAKVCVKDLLEALNVASDILKKCKYK